MLDRKHTCIAWNHAEPISKDLYFSFYCALTASASPLILTSFPSKPKYPTQFGSRKNLLFPFNFFVYGHKTTHIHTYMCICNTSVEEQGKVNLPENTKHK